MSGFEYDVRKKDNCMKFPWVTSLSMRKKSNNEMLILLVVLDFRPSPRKEVKVINAFNPTASSSFQDFQQSVSDAWDLGDDEFCNISSMYLSFINISLFFFMYYVQKVNFQCID